MKKLLVIGIIGLLVLSIGIAIYDKDKEVEMEEPKYQGPVPEGYDEEHFRETGETKPMEIKE